MSRVSYEKGQRADIVSTVRAIDEAARTVDFVVSDTSLDRHDTVVKQWVLDSYLSNPVVLFGHDTKSLPIGRAVAINESNGQLVAKIEFAPADVYEFADQVFRLISAGYLNAVSAGFIPGQVEYSQEADSFLLLDNELVEISVVPVPSNRNALKKAVEDGALVGRGWELISESEDSVTISPEEPTVEARSALESWCARQSEESAAIGESVQEPEVPEPSEAERAFFAAHLVIRTICRDLGIDVPESPAEYPEALVSIVSKANAKPEPAISEAVDQKLSAIMNRLDEIEAKIAPQATSYPDTGTTRTLRDIMSRASRLAAEG